MKTLIAHYLDAFLKKLASVMENENVKKAILEAKHFLPFDKLPKLFTIEKVVEKKEYFYAETIFAHKIVSVRTGKEENFRMHFLIIHPKAERKILEADPLFKSFVEKRFTEYPAIKTGYEGAYTMKDMETGKTITDKLATLKPFTAMMATSYTELNRSQLSLLGTLSKFVMLSDRSEKQAAEKTLKSKEVKAVKTKKAAKKKSNVKK